MAGGQGNFQGFPFPQRGLLRCLILLAGSFQSPLHQFRHWAVSPRPGPQRDESHTLDLQRQPGLAGEG